MHELCRLDGKLHAGNRFYESAAREVWGSISAFGFYTHVDSGLQPTKGSFKEALKLIPLDLILDLT